MAQPPIRGHGDFVSTATSFGSARIRSRPAALFLKHCTQTVCAEVDQDRWRFDFDSLSACRPASCASTTSAGSVEVPSRSRSTSIPTTGRREPDPDRSANQRKRGRGNGEAPGATGERRARRPPPAGGAWWCGSPGSARQDKSTLSEAVYERYRRSAIASNISTATR